MCVIVCNSFTLLTALEKELEDKHTLLRMKQN